MPRSETSVAGRILGFFQTAPLEGAELVLGLAKDVVLARKRTAVPPPGSQGPGPVTTQAVARKKSHKKKARKVAAPAEEAAGTGEDGYGGGESDDVPMQ